MTTTIIIPPIGLPVTLAEVKAFLKIEHDLEDALLNGLIEAATDHVQASCSLALLSQTRREFLQAPFPRFRPGENAREVSLINWPVISIVTAIAYDATGTGHEIDLNETQLDRVNRPCRLSLSSLMPPLSIANGLEIDVICGFGETGADIPPSIHRALLVLVAHWYEFRGHVSASSQPVSIPPGIDALLAPFKRGRI